jgi:hypothetical protein
MPSAAGLDAAFTDARNTTAAMIATAGSTAFDSSVHGNVVGTLTWAAFASAAIGPMAVVGERDLNTSPQSRIWTVQSGDGPFRVQMKSDIDDIREEQLSLFGQSEFAGSASTRQELVLLTWNAAEPRFVLMHNGHVLWSLAVTSLLVPADVIAATSAPKRSIDGKDEDRAAERNRKSS